MRAHRLTQFKWRGLSGGSLVEIPPANAGHMASVSDQEDSRCRRAADSVLHSY